MLERMSNTTLRTIIIFLFKCLGNYIEHIIYNTTPTNDIFYLKVNEVIQ